MQTYRNILMALLFLSSQASYAALDINIEVGPANWNFENDRDLDSKTMPYTSIEYRPGQAFSVTLGVSAETLDGGIEDDVEFKGYDISLRKYFNRRSQWEPYFSLVIAQSTFNRAEINDDETQLQFGIGTHYNFTERWSATGSYHLVQGWDDDHATDHLFKLGIRWSFKDNN